MPDNLENHKATLDSLYQQTKDELWTPPFATLVLLLFGIPFITVFFNIAVFSFGHWLVALIVYLIEAAAPVFVLYRHRQKIDETVRQKARALEATNPGIYEAYEKRR
jgi:hypothetical protein